MSTDFTVHCEAGEQSADGEAVDEGGAVGVGGTIDLVQRLPVQCRARCTEWKDRALPQLQTRLALQTVDEF